MSEQNNVLRKDCKQKLSNQKFINKKIKKRLI